MSKNPPENHGRQMRPLRSRVEILVVKILKISVRGGAPMLVFLFFVDVCQAGGLLLNSGPERISLIELYSSEGCSSCPPAERWLVNLRQNSGLWKKFVPVEFHVDYWNQLGWVDPFSNRHFANRQRIYSREWGSGRVYTPGFVQDGKEWRREGALQSSPGGKVGNLRVRQVSSDTFEIIFQPLGKLQKSYSVVGTYLGNGLVTKVPRGENEGKILRHEFVVLAMKKVALKKGEGGDFVAQVPLSSSFKAKPKSLSVAFWVTAGTRQAPLQAVGGDVDSSVKFANDQSHGQYASSLPKPR